MQKNISKTKEMVLVRLNTDNLFLLSTSLGLVERVTSFKLLGINFDAKLSWSLHINISSAKASKCLYFLKQLKRAGVPPDQLLHFYVAAIRPVLEWFSFLNPCCAFLFTSNLSKNSRTIE